MVKSGESQYLIGEFESNVVSGHRLSIPAKLRKELGNKIVISKGYEGCLLIVPEQKWETLVEPLVSRSFLDRNLRDTLRFLVGSSFQVILDSQGRFVIPQNLREYTDIKFSESQDKNAIFVGLVNWVEVWSKDKWLQQSKNIELNADSIAQELITQ